MNKIVSCLIGFAVGASASGLVSYYITKKKYLEKADKEIASVKDSFKKLYSNKTESQKSDKKSKAVNVKKNTIKKSNIMVSKKEDTMVDYRKYVNDYDSNKKEEPADKVDDIDGVYEITDEDYANSECNVMSVRYYPVDDILTYDSGEGSINEPIKDRDYYVNEKILKDLRNGNRDYIYIHNTKLDLDIEITVMPDRYIESAPDPAAKAIRRKAIEDANREADDEDN